MVAVPSKQKGGILLPACHKDNLKMFLTIDWRRSRTVAEDSKQEIVE
jgi:hypothetical protein